MVAGSELAIPSVEKIRTRLRVTISMALKMALKSTGMQMTSMILIICPPKFVCALYISLYAVAKKLKQCAIKKIFKIQSRSLASSWHVTCMLLVAAISGLFTKMSPRTIAK